MTTSSGYLLVYNKLLHNDTAFARKTATIVLCKLNPTVTTAYTPM